MTLIRERRPADNRAAIPSQSTAADMPQSTTNSARWIRCNSLFAGAVKKPDGYEVLCPRAEFEGTFNLKVPSTASSALDGVAA